MGRGSPAIYKPSIWAHLVDITNPLGLHLRWIALHRWAASMRNYLAFPRRGVVARNDVASRDRQQLGSLTQALLRAHHTWALWDRLASSLQDDHDWRKYALYTKFFVGTPKNYSIYSSILSLLKRMRQDCRLTTSPKVRSQPN